MYAGIPVHLEIYGDLLIQLSKLKGILQGFSIGEIQQGY